MADQRLAPLSFSTVASKMSAFLARPRYLLTETGVGYRFNPVWGTGGGGEICHVA